MGTIQSLFIYCSSRLQSVLVVSTMGLILSSCGAGQKGALIGDYQAVSTCPASGCADSAASADKISFTTDNTDIRIKPADRFVEIAGDCYVSTFPSHVIEVSVNNSIRSPASINFGSSASILKCSMGRYNVYVNACDPDLRAINRYNVTLKLKPMDEAGNYVDDGNTVNLSFVRDTVATACP